MKKDYSKERLKKLLKETRKVRDAWHNIMDDVYEVRVWHSCAEIKEYKSFESRKELIEFLEE